jgi:nicotinate phosphoribosyltransferase
MAAHPPATPALCESLALLTDLYQLTMACGYFRTGTAEREAVFHLSFRNAPFHGGFTIAAGLEAVIDFVERFHFSRDDLEYLASIAADDGRPLFDRPFLEHLRALRLTVDIDAIPEGTVVFPQEPLVRVRGPLLQCQLLESALLNLINFPTLIATKAARICLATLGSGGGAEDRPYEPVLEFGLRRAQGIDGALTASRAAYIGGCSATSNLLAGRRFGIPVKGTHAHSWVMSFDSELESFDAYADAMPNNCVFLVDTYDTLQGVRHAVGVGRRLRGRGQKLLGIRLDSGDLAYLSIEARKILDAAGFRETSILATNDLDERIIASLKEQGAAISVWGVGTRLATAYDQPALGGVYKLSALRARPPGKNARSNRRQRSGGVAGGLGGGDWEYKIKLSEQLAKTSVPGILQVRRFQVEGENRADMIFNELAPPPVAQAALRAAGGRGRAGKKGVIVDPMDPTRRRTIPAEALAEDLLVPVFQGGRGVYARPTLAEIRERARRQLDAFYPGVRRAVNPHQYPVGLESGLSELRQRMILEARPV